MSKTTSVRKAATPHPDMHHPTQSTRSPTMCPHETPCPSANAIDHDAARVVAAFPEQGWSLLCNGVIVFDDTGELLPDGSCVEPHRGPARHTPTPQTATPQTPAQQAKDGPALAAA